MRFSRIVVASTLYLASGCHEERVEANYTAVSVVSHFDGALPITRLAISGTLEDGRAAFNPGEFDVAPVTPTPPRRSSSTLIILDDVLAGAKLRVHVEGYSAQRGLLASGTDEVRLELGEVATASIALVATSTCGDGLLGAGETCDDANTIAGDGCDTECNVEATFVCAGRPSRCFEEAKSVFVDAAAACAGNGSNAMPFCTIGDGVGAGKTTVIVRAGVYREQLALSGVRVEIFAEPGAILESATSALRVDQAARVEITNLKIRGGAAIDGLGTNARIIGGEIGPSNALAVALAQGASLELSRTTISGNAGGGLRLDSDGLYRIENVVIAGNGSTSSNVGGVAILRSSAGSRFAHATIVDNVAAPGSGATGVRCAATATIANSIIWANQGDRGVDLDACRTFSSDVGPFASPPANLGASNFSEDPELELDFHLGRGSPCIDRGDAAFAADTDIDGDARPRGAGVDVGADEARY